MSRQEMEAVVIGAGFAGMHMLWRLKQLGMKTRVLEAGGDVGGTWYWNRYPGARCDTESVEYSYAFSEALQQEWHWTEKYAAQPEILTYANHVADRFELRKDIQFDTRVVSAVYDEQRLLWVIETDRGDCFEAKYCITATGCLSAPNFPAIPGIDDFQGERYHTGRWPHEGVSFKGKRVGIIGTGATGIQAIPMIAREADHLYVFQRTANYTLPARNCPLDPGEERAMKARYSEHREQQRNSQAAQRAHPPEGPRALDWTPDERERHFEWRWNQGGQTIMITYADLMTDERANKTVAEFVHGKIRRIVKDPVVAEILCPKGYPMGAKRLSLDTNYYETYNRSNVTLTDIKASPIERITPTGLRTREADFCFDALIFATGFDAVTGPLTRIDVRGKGGRSLKDTWTSGPRSYLGLMVAGFPNLFTITGPGSPSIIANVIFSIDQHVDWIGDCIGRLRERSIDSIEATEAAQDAWVRHVREVANATLFPKADSWYVGANIPGKPRVFLPYVGGLGNYRRKCLEIAAVGYEGFVLT
jgi:cation diffusion facilitator CzcD-associated flavoprotein CzcO